MAGQSGSPLRALARGGQPLKVCRPLPKEPWAAEQAAANPNPLEPEVKILLVRPADSAMHLGGHARDLLTDLRYMGQGMTGHEGRLFGKGIEAVGRIPNQGPGWFELADHLGAHMFHSLE